MAFEDLPEDIEKIGKTFADAAYTVPLLLIFLFVIIGLSTCVKEPKILPFAEFSYTGSADCTIPFVVSFQNLSRDATVYRWDFGDDSPISHHENPIHVYNTEGVYTVRLTAYGSGGTHESILTVYAVSTPVATISVSDTTVTTNDSINFFSTVQSALPVTYVWSFGDGYTSHLPNPTHAYSYPGTYSVVLTVTNACGSTYVIVNDYIVVSQTGVPPVPDFIANHTNINTGSMVNFTDLSVNNAQTWLWSFEGGTPATATSQHPTNIQYNTAGTYNVSLTVGNTYGDSTITKTAYINVVPAGSAPVANFSASATNITAGSSINFTDLSLNNPNSWQWQLQGGTPNTSAAQHPTNITYNTPGTYSVSLTVSNTQGNDTHTKTAYINVTPQTITQANIKKITIENMPFPTAPPFFRNPYYIITNNSNVILRDGRNEYLNGITQFLMPVSWDLSPYFLIPVLNNQYKVRIFDWRSNPSMDIFVGEVLFNLNNYTGPPNPFPPTITLLQNNMKIILDIEWL